MQSRTTEPTDNHTASTFPNMEEALIGACEQGDIHTMRSILHENKNLAHLVQGYRGSLLHIACEKNNVDTAKMLIFEYDVDVEKKNARNITPLAMACERGNIEVARMLISEAKVDVNESGKPSYCRSVLALACHSGHLELARMLIFEFGAKLGAKHWMHGGTELMQACNGGYADLAKMLLLEAKADTHYIDDKKNTILHYACRGNVLPVVKILLNKSADTNVQNSDGNTPAHIACSNGNLSLVKYLIKYKADMSLRNEHGNTAFHRAVSCQRFFVAEWLLKSHMKYKIGIDTWDIWGSTPILSACYNGDYNMIDLLVEAKAKLDIPNTSGETLLYRACRQCNHSVLNLLIFRHGMNPFMTEPSGQMIIDHKNISNVVRTLIRNKMATKHLTTLMADIRYHQRTPAQPAAPLRSFARSRLFDKNVLSIIHRFLMEQ